MTEAIDTRRPIAGADDRHALTTARTRAMFGWRTTTAAMAVVLAVGLIVRWIAAMTLSPHVDEPSSVLAAHVAADRGLPILPSGTPYFQGLTLSYLLVPFVWFGVGTIGDLHLMRLVPVAAGVITLWLCYRLGRHATGDPRVGVVMAALVAIDPVSVQWSAHVRMYSLLQALTVALAWAWIRLLQGVTAWRQVALVTALFWVAVFTHVGAALLGPAMAVSALVVHRRGLLRQWRVLVTLVLSAGAPAVLMSVNKVFGTSNEPVRESTSVPFWSFVGDNLLAPLARLRIATDGMVERLTAGITLYWLVPGLIVAASTIVGARYLLHRAGASRETRVAISTLLSFYWLPMLVIVIFTVSPKVRYLLHLHVLGYLFVAVLVVAMLRRVEAAMVPAPGTVARQVAVVGVIAAIGSGLIWRLDNTVVQPDYNDAMAYVAAEHQAGEPVIVTLPPVGYLSIDESSRDDLYFLAGSQGWTRAERYTRWDDEGRLIDYWIGADSIVSTTRLDAILEEHPDAWVIADEGRLEDDWTSKSAIENVIRAEMYPVYQSEGGAVVYRTKPESLTAGGSASDRPAPNPPAKPAAAYEQE